MPSQISRKTISPTVISKHQPHKRLVSPSVSSSVNPSVSPSVSPPVSQLNSFITAPPDQDLTQLMAALKAHHIDVLDRPPTGPIAFPTTDQLLASIHQADLVLGILGPAATSGNVLFELGCAAALGKQSWVIIPSNSPNNSPNNSSNAIDLPSHLKSLVHIRSNLDDRDALHRALAQILQSPAPSTAPSAASSRAQNTASDPDLASHANVNLLNQTKPLGSVAPELLEKLEALGKTPSRHDLLGIVLHLLHASKIPTKIQQKHPDLHHDLAIWVEELEAYFGNPIPIDLKGQLQTPGQAKYAAEQTLTYMTLSPVRTAILFATHITLEAREVLATYPNLYCFDLAEFLQRLQQKSLGQILRQERQIRIQERLR